ncbi:MAG: hypothetical protein HXX09_00055 [Bacteroidetes bacterium]|nr:hypothetical protein [Bacteroidota bacterium]
MDKTTLNQQIRLLLETISEQSEAISKYNNRIPQIEIDIILNNTRNLYEKYCELDKLNNRLYSYIDEEPITLLKEYEKPQIIPEKIIEEPKAEIIPEPEPVIEEIPVIEPEKIEIEEEKTLVVDETEEIIEAQPETLFEIQETTTTEITKEEVMTESTNPSIDLFSSSTTTTETIKVEKKSFNEKIAGNMEDKSVAHNFQQNKISDLKAAIGMNDRFLFINEIFKGNLQEYSEQLNLLNNQNNLEDAISLLNGIGFKHSVREDLKSFNTLKELITRRYQ